MFSELQAFIRRGDAWSGAPDCMTPGSGISGLEADEVCVYTNPVEVLLLYGPRRSTMTAQSLLTVANVQFERSTPRPDDPNPVQDLNITLYSH